jgi:hypothetical protein
MQMIDKVFPKYDQNPISEEHVKEMIESWLKNTLEKKENELLTNQITIETLFENMNNEEDEEQHGSFATKTKTKILNAKKKYTIIDVICNKSLTREEKLVEINRSLSDKTRKYPFPQLEGDKVTFIGSTFLRSGEKEPYLNHCLVLNTCDLVDGV